MNNFQDSDIWNATLSEFRERTASHEPTPGGGSVAAVSATFGLALVIMALEITSKKTVATEDQQQLANVITTARSRLQNLSQHANEDILAFQGYIQALSLPKVTDEEKVIRKQALNQALTTATNVPLAAAREIVEAIKIAHTASELSHLQIISDVGAGAAILGGALTAVLFNVDVNLPGLKDPTIKETIVTERENLAREGASVVATTLKRVQERIEAG